MSKELKTPAEVTEAQENDKKEQATLTFFSLDSLTYLDKIKNMLADVSTELNSSEPEPKEHDREEEKHVEEVHPKKYLTPVEIDVLKKALDNYKHLCCFELRDSEVITDKSLYKQELKEFRLTVDLLSDLANVRNVIFERTEFIEVLDEDEIPF